MRQVTFLGATSRDQIDALSGRISEVDQQIEIADRETVELRVKVLVEKYEQGDPLAWSEPCTPFFVPTLGIRGIRAREMYVLLPDGRDLALLDAVRQDYRAWDEAQRQVYLFRSAGWPLPRCLEEFEADLLADRCKRPKGKGRSWVDFQRNFTLCLAVEALQRVGITAQARADANKASSGCGKVGAWMMKGTDNHDAVKGIWKNRAKIQAAALGAWRYHLEKLIVN